MATVTEEMKEIMDSITAKNKSIDEDWAKIQKKYSIAAARRIRKALDEISHEKVDLRKVMIMAEAK